MIVIAGAVVVLAFFVVGVLIGTSVAHHWMSRRIHTVGTERRALFEQRAEAELDMRRRPVENGR